MAKILIVDDSATILAMTRDLLQEAGHVVAVQSSPAGLPAIVTREKPDLILLDVSLPVLDGDQALRLLRARGFSANVIVLLYSSKPVDELTRLTKACGAQGFISKSEVGPTLVAKVNEYLANRPQSVDDFDVTVE